MRYEVIELKDGRTGIYDNETKHIMVLIEDDNLSKNNLDKGVGILNYLCNKFDENDKRYNGENILARLRTKIWIFLSLFFLFQIWIVRMVANNICNRNIYIVWKPIYYCRSERFYRKIGVDKYESLC